MEEQTPLLPTCWAFKKKKYFPMQAADLASPETCEHLDCVMTEEGLKTRGERWDWQHKALLMGTQCAGTPRQTALSLWRERQNGRERKRKAAR